MARWLITSSTTASALATIASTTSLFHGVAIGGRRSEGNHQLQTSSIRLTYSPSTGRQALGLPAHADNDVWT